MKQERIHIATEGMGDKDTGMYVTHCGVEFWEENPGIYVTHESQTGFHGQELVDVFDHGALAGQACETCLAHVTNRSERRQ